MFYYWLEPLPSEKGKRAKFLYRKQNRDGYVMLYLPQHPNSQKNGYVFEHIAIMANKLARIIGPKETIHHKNGVRNDNRPENLEVWNSRHPKGQRSEDKVAHAVEILSAYEPKLLASPAPEESANNSENSTCVV